MTQSTPQSDSTQPTGPTKPTKRKSWLVIALCASLAINLLVVGVVIGARINGGPPHAAMMNNAAFSVGHAIRQFDEQRATQLWPIARPHFKGLRPELRKLRDAQREWERSFATEPVDLQALDRNYAALHKNIAAIQQMNFGAIRALAAELSPEERKQLLRALRKPRKHHHRNPRSESSQDNPRPIE